MKLHLWGDHRIKYYLLLLIISLHKESRVFKLDILIQDNNNREISILDF